MTVKINKTEQAKLDKDAKYGHLPPIKFTHSSAAGMTA